MGYLEIWQRACNQEAIRKSDASAPEAVRAACRRGLSLAQEYGGPGLTEGAKSRARSMAAGQAVSSENIGRMVNFFSRHQENRADPSAKEPTPGAVAWLIWGGDAGKAWANSQYKNNPDNGGKTVSKSEGSRGGKILGHTRSGKPIYAHDHEIYSAIHAKSPDGTIFENPARSPEAAKKTHPAYTTEDHKDAARLHGRYFAVHEIRGKAASSIIRVAAAHWRAVKNG